jgi:hypothetical protein
VQVFYFGKITNGIWIRIEVKCRLD